MGVAIDLSALTFGPEEVKEFSDLLKLKVVEAPVITEWCTVYPDILHNREIGFIRPTLGLMGVVDAGCDAAENVEGSTAATKKTWVPTPISIIKDTCYKDLDNNFAKYQRKQGSNISDLIGTQYFDYLLSFIPNDVNRMIFRKAWFENTAIKNVSAGGNLTNGKDVKYFNTFNGIFAQLATILTARPAQKITITENAQTTRALQYSALTPAAAYGYFTALFDAAPSTLVEQSDRICIATRGLVVKAARHLQSINTPTVLERLENGYEVTTIDGVKVLVIPFMDECLNSYFFDGTKVDSPHRAIYTLVSNLGVGFGTSSGFSEIVTMFDNWKEKNRIRIKDTMDSKVLDDEMILVAM